MSEDDAKTKWCPMVRVMPSGLVPDLTSKEPHCVGSACMMWRVTQPRLTKVPNLGDGGPDDLDMWAPGGVGYCGLAGKP